MSGGPDLADWLRWLGLGCELTGLGFTAWGISELRRNFSDRPGIIGATTAHVGGAWTWVFDTATGLARAFARAWQWLHRTARSRWNQLLSFLRRLRSRPPERLGQATTTIDPSDATVRLHPGDLQVTAPSVNERLAALEERDETIERSIGQVRDDIGRLATGGLSIEAAGLALLVCGLILSSVSAGLAELIRSLLDL